MAAQLTGWGGGKDGGSADWKRRGKDGGSADVVERKGKMAAQLT
jgi:hypothetical protein